MKRYIVAILAFLLLASSAFSQAGYIKVDLSGRTLIGQAPEPVLSETVDGYAIVVVKIWVNKYGSVTKAELDKEQTIVKDKESLSTASVAAAKKLSFVQDPKAPSSSEGTVTYVFTPETVKQPVQDAPQKDVQTATPQDDKPATSTKQSVSSSSSQPRYARLYIEYHTASTLSVIDSSFPSTIKFMDENGNVESINENFKDKSAETIVLARLSAKGYRVVLMDTTALPSTDQGATLIVSYLLEK